MPDDRPSTGRRRRWADLVGIVWVLGAAGAMLAPALVHGTSLGTYDVLSVHGLSARPGGGAHYTGPSDQIQMLIPWTSLAWTQVHHGQLPLWNPYSALGMPLAFNWQSAVFSLPALVGYLVPLHLAYTVGLYVTLAVAGSGVYVLCRVLGLSALAAALAATTFELSGPLVGWLGWPLAGALSFIGWLTAAVLLVLRARRRVGPLVLLAVAVAFTIYAGQPETSVQAGVALVTFAAVTLFVRALHGDAGGVLRPAIDVVLGVVAGGALAAPLLLPGLQVASGSVRRVAGSYGTLPARDAIHLIVQGFDGLPVSSSRWFGHSIYPESAAYVGVIVVVLALVAVAREHRRPEVIALVAVVAVSAVLVFVSPVVSALGDLTRVRSAAWHRSVGELAFGLAVLAGVGTDVLVRDHRRRDVRWWVAGGFAGAAAVLVVLWVAGRGRLPHAEAVVRARSFIWPAVSTAVGLAVAAGLALVRPRPAHHGESTATDPRRAGLMAGGVLLACQTAFVVTAGAPLLASSPGLPPPTPPMERIARAVGTSTVAFAAPRCHGPDTLGILPNANVLYGVHELPVYDPMTPLAFFRTWRTETGQPGAPAGAPLVFCPAVARASLARRYGVGFVLTSRGAPAPPGTRRVTTVGDEDLYSVPGAAVATLTALNPAGSLPGPDAQGASASVRHPDPANWTMTTDASRASVLRVRVTAVPGWRATVDGRPLPLEHFAGVMLQARVGPGRHVVVLRYWPTTFTVGIVMAGVSALALLAGAATALVGRRRPAGAPQARRPPLASD
ncbi:MAG TPA: YfhO family protein [Acidimicrobiales bacterium]|nr:YfhO family protein [Acidimicrobiales bacterium]